MNKRLIMTSCAVFCGTFGNLAVAGGMERTRQPINLLFEDGTYATVGVSHRSPSITGDSIPENMSMAYSNTTFGYKRDLTDRLSFATSAYQPAGADVDYADNAIDLFAYINFQAVSAALKYQISDGFSAYGGVKYVEADAMTNLAGLGAVVGPYGQAWTQAKKGEFGTFGGVAYELDDIKMRVSLTYNSKVDFVLPTSLTSGGPFPLPNDTTGGLPQSITLDFRSGIAKDTLLFGSVHWAEWGKQNVFVGPVQISSFQNTIDLNLGVARRLNDQWAVIVAANYLAPNGGVAGITGRFAPYDGYQGLSLAVQHTRGNAKIRFGMNYTKLNSALTAFGPFSNNDVISGGVSVGYSF
jgi:long-subunit fatty acid transport protein